MTKILTKNCKECDIVFKSNNWRKKYCGVICAKKAWSKQHQSHSARSLRRRHGLYEKWAGYLRDGGYLVVNQEELIKIQKTGKSVWYI